MTENITLSENFEQFLISHPFKGTPENLYQPMNYIMQLGGKRIRPGLLLLSYASLGKEWNEDIFQLALAVETFHNFSLVHDDIMDNASIRRGKSTVHTKWNPATAILAGDNLLIHCYELLLKTNLPDKELFLREFTKMAIEVCEGQQMDMNLPLQENFSEDEYLQMIRLKTAVLPATAMKLGAMAAGAEASVSNAFYETGLNLGMAFQLQDDFLDAFGNSPETGKMLGGDIIENKRTLLFIHALKHLKQMEREELLLWYNKPVQDQELKIKKVRELFITAGSDVYLLNKKSGYENEASELLQKICPDSESKRQIRSLINVLKSRKS